MTKPDMHTAADTNIDSSTEPFYYYFDEKIYLQEHRDKVYLQLVPEAEFVQHGSSFNGIVSSDKIASGIITLPLSAGGDTQAELNKLRNSPETRFASYITSYKGRRSAVTNEFAVKLKSPSDYGRLVELVEVHNCRLLEQKRPSDTKFTVEVPKDSEAGTISIANAFYETGLFKFSSPNFIIFDVAMSNDTYYCDQWMLKNSGQYGASGIDIDIEDAWEITEGRADVKVAVIDSQVDLSHPDLQANLLPGYDAIVADGYPMEIPQKESHGTNVAGIIGAVKDNAIGIAGVAPNVKMLPVRVMYYDSIVQHEIGNESWIADGVDWAWRNGADVINLSLGGEQPNSAISDAISDAVQYGRTGKGCVVVVSIGNNMVSAIARPHHVMAVGAASFDGKRKTQTSPDGENWFSGYGSWLDVIAPGVRISTTDRVGRNGSNPVINDSGITILTKDYTDNNYTKYFRGTSSAAPCVSGIAALILSEFPDLAERQVRRAIELSCTRPSGYTYYVDDEYPSGVRNDEVGYGFVNAYRALAEAGVLNNQNLTDAIPGFDFTLTNNSSHGLNAIYIGLTGDIQGIPVSLFSHDPGDLPTGSSIGYPNYRGVALSQSAGIGITNMELELYAEVDDGYDGYFYIGVGIDRNPTMYNHYSFSESDNTIRIALPASSVPDASRRRIYIDIIDF